MSAKIVLPPSATWAGSVGRQTIGSLGSSEDSTNGSLKKPNFNERHPKVVRSLTVVAYIFCVSLAAIILSAYYVVLWTPTGHEAPQKKNVNASLCRGVTYGPDGTLELVPQYKQSRFTYSSSRHMRPRTSKLVYRKSKIGPPHQQQSIDYDLSLQRDSLIGDNHTSTNDSGNNAPALLYDDQLETIEPSLGDNGMEEIATSLVPNSPSPPSPAPNSIILRKLFAAKRITTTEKPR